MITHEFTNPDALAAALAADVAAKLRDELVTGGAVLAVSGGTTPVKFFEALAKIKLDWGHVTVTLVDDRWVPETERRSNAALVKRHLLQHEAAKAHFVPLVTAHGTPEEGLATAQASVAALGLPLTVAVLGIGTDGHTASLFPGAEGLEQAMSPRAGQRVETIRVEAAEEPRVTLTLPVLLAAKHVVIHIEGETKWHVLEAAMRDGPVADMPVRAVLARVPAPDVYWCA